MPKKKVVEKPSVEKSPQPNSSAATTDTEFDRLGWQTAGGYDII